MSGFILSFLSTSLPFALSLTLARNAIIEGNVTRKYIAALCCSFFGQGHAEKHIPECAHPTTPLSQLFAFYV